MTIGVEIEFTGIQQSDAADVIAQHFGTEPWGGCMGWEIKESNKRNAREWKVVGDSSIRVENGGGQCELVTPILTEADINDLQEIASKLKASGAVVNESCGLHVHIGADGLTAPMIRNLVNNVASHEDLLIQALNVHIHRRRYCKPTDKNFLNRLNAKKPQTLDELKKVWYGDDGEHNYHYDSSRYHTLNLHALFTKGTVEFRIFNGTLEPDEIKTAIQLSIALVANAKAVKRTLYKPVQTDNERFAMRTWLTRPEPGLNLNGTEYSTLRHHLTINLSGNSAWRFAI